jgi:hypothetical protein
MTLLNNDFECKYETINDDVFGGIIPGLIYSSR